MIDATVSDSVVTIINGGVYVASVILFALTKIAEEMDDYVMGSTRNNSNSCSVQSCKQGKVHDFQSKGYTTKSDSISL